MKDKTPVLVCTEFRGVFFGFINRGDIEKENLMVHDARMAISWGTDKGVMQLAETGPTKTTMISAKADVFLRKVSAVFFCTEEATIAWTG